MPLKDQIQDLANRIGSDLRSSYDYYDHTNLVWRLVEGFASEGREITAHGVQTGTVANATALALLGERYIAGYLANDRVKLGAPTSDQVDQFAEIKASRDILLHNRGIVNYTYLEKSGARAR